MGKLDQNKLLKSTKLLESAFDLFTKNGVTNTSISDISSNAGVAKGTFYLYFKDKFDIRDRLIAYKSAQLISAAIEDMETTGKDFKFDEKLLFLMESIIDKLSAEPQLVTFISKNLGWGVFKSAFTNAAANMTEKTNIDAGKYIKELLKGNVSDPEIMMFMIIELLSSVCHSSVLYGDPAPIAQIKPHLLNSISAILDIYRI